jgi:hypothetical protein
MFLNFELEMFLMVLLLLIVISMIPLIELKYNSDLYENIEKFNKYCLNNDAKLLSELDVKDTYMWNISSYIYDYDNLSNFFYKRNQTGTGANDYIGLNRNVAKVSSGDSGDDKYIDNVMKIYNYYLYMSLGFFIVLIVFFVSQANILINIGSASASSDYAICMSGSGSSGSSDTGTADIFDVFKNYMYALFVYVALFIIFFSLILKKLTELYADTETYEYIMLMKELDILLKENKPANAGITDILKKYSKNKINDIAHIALNNKAIISEHATKALKDKGSGSIVKYDNNENFKITLKNIEKLEYYNSKEAKDKVKNKISEIFQFIYVYIIFLIVPIYMLSISLQGNYMYLLFTIIAIIIFSVSAYNIYNTLQN